MKNIQRYKKIIGIDVKALLSATHNIHKMAWEQVLLLAIYSRQQYFYEDSLGFKNRIQLVHEVQKYRDISRDVCRDVLIQLEQGKGSTDIIKMLLNHEHTMSKTVLRAMEDKSLAFGPDKSERLYSYYAMYMVLHDPLTVFQSLRGFEGLSVPDYIVKVYQRMHSGPLQMLVKDNLIFAENLSLDGLVDLLEERGTPVNTSEFISEVTGQLANDIGKYLKAAYEKLMWCDAGRTHSYEPITLFNEMCAVRQEQQQFMLNFNVKILRRFLHLGQIEGVMAGVRAEILKAFDPSAVNHFQNQPDNQQFAGVIDALSDWYKHANTGLIKKIDGVPRLIASLLDFDLRYRIGIGSKYFGLVPMEQFNFRLISRDYSQLVTGIIRHTLFASGSSFDLQGALHCYQSIDQYLEKFSRSECDRSQTSLLMKTWADQEEGPMVERFKKLPVYLKSGKKQEFVNAIISNQRRKSQDQSYPYPIRSFFPLPLWAMEKDL
ncbi:hypothetical protein [Pectobacterium sp. A5351]|uniref:hypothetical protein n=1 Tax=Pectobacterium sp. A5351 TaxID=2914983 RepID=UPI00232E58F7|nr:hypothetical protein [Pectobacterium sp. A5351]WCG82270.1 hypothetical protein O1Q74_15310 [Pectobacterium sp. A5351]